MSQLKVYLETAEYGYEEFDAPEDGDIYEQLHQLIAKSAQTTKEDLVERRVGVVIRATVKPEWGDLGEDDEDDEEVP
jgi:hypothetical protein